MLELRKGSRRALDAGRADGRRCSTQWRPALSARQPHEFRIQARRLRFEFAFEDRLLPPRFECALEDVQTRARAIRPRRNASQATEGRSLRFVRYFDDFPGSAVANLWADTGRSMRSSIRSEDLRGPDLDESLQRCVLMTTDPGDLVLDPTCGSGTTAYVAEQWGRRWITIDTSRVPLALARQRLLTATYSWYELKDEERGPAGGFVYMRKQNKKGEEVGGIVPHITLKSIANNEPPEEEVLVDRPEVDNKYVRVTGPFAVEATIPTPVDWEGDGIEDSGAQQAEDYGSFVDRMIEVLRRSPVLHVGGGKTVKLWNVRRPAKTLSLSAEAMAANGRGEARGVRLRPRERRGQREARARRAEGSRPQELRPPLRHRLRHPGSCARAGREVDRRRLPSRHLRPGHARPHDGRPAEDDAVEPDLQRVRAARSEGAHR